MDVHPDKCKVMHMNNTTKEPPIKIKINDIEVDWAESMKYLGVTLEKRLKFKKHIKDKTSKSLKKLSTFKSMIGKTWGPSPKLILYMFKNIILPAMTYASFIWSH